MRDWNGDGLAQELARNGNGAGLERGCNTSRTSVEPRSSVTAPGVDDATKPIN